MCEHKNFQLTSFMFLLQDEDAYEFWGENVKVTIGQIW